MLSLQAPPPNIFSLKVMRFGLAEFLEQRNQQDWLEYLRTAGASNTGLPCLPGSNPEGSGCCVCVPVSLHEMLACVLHWTSLPWSMQVPLSFISSLRRQWECGTSSTHHSGWCTQKVGGWMRLSHDTFNIYQSVQTVRVCVCLLAAARGRAVIHVHAGRCILFIVADGGTWAISDVLRLSCLLAAVAAGHAAACMHAAC